MFVVTEHIFYFCAYACYVTPIFLGEKFCKLILNPSKWNKSTSHDFVAHFIEVEVDLWQVCLEAFMQEVLVHGSINLEWLPTVTISLYSHNATANTQAQSTLCQRNLKKVFSLYNTPQKYENTTITGHFGFVLEENLGRKMT